MTTRPVALVLDLGTSAIKAGIMDLTGSPVGIGQAEYVLDTPAADRVECAPSVYWHSTKRAVHEALVAATSNLQARPQISGITVACQGETLICLDEQDQPLRPAIVWLDNRSIAEAEEIEAAFGADAIYEHTGQIECVATWPATKILWLQRHEPEVFARSRHFVLLEDWILQILTGSLVGERTLYSSSLLLDIRSKDWWDPMLRHLDLDPDRLAHLVDTGSHVGRLRPSVAEELGLAAGLPVIAGCLDQVGAALAGGNLSPGRMTELTGSVLGMVSCFPKPPPRSAGLPIYLHAVPDMYVALPYAQTAGLVLRWARDTFTYREGKASTPYDDLVAEAAEITPGADGLIFLPHLCGAAFPEFDLLAQGAIVGLTLAHGRGHIVRAALEAVGFMLRNALEAIQAAGVPIEEITSLGSASRSKAWTQIKADICDVPVRRLRTTEATLAGGALVVSVATGYFSGFAEAETATDGVLDVTMPDGASRTAYDVGFQRYRDLYQTLAPYFRDRVTSAPAGV